MGVYAQPSAPIASAQVASVGQEPVLFSGSVRDNIVYGLKSCGDEKVMAAARGASADGFIQEMEHGLDSGTFGQKRNWRFLGVWVVSPQVHVWCFLALCLAPTSPSPTPGVL